METEKKVQDARGFVVLKGKVFGFNMEGKQPRMHESIARDLESRGVSMGQLNFNNFRVDELASQTEKNLANRHIER